MSRAAEISTGLLGLSSIGLALAVVAASFLRLRFGVDITDESYYASISYRFVLGDVPYVHDLNIRQNAAVLIWPLAELSVALNDGSDGLILFLRHCYFVVRLGLVILALRVLWNRVPRKVSPIIAVVPCAYFFFVPALSYNTVAGSAMVASLLFLLLWWETGRRRFGWAMVGSAAVGVFAHPGALLAGAALWGIAYWRSPNDRRWLAIATTAVAGAALAIVLLASIALGVDNLRKLMHSGGSYTPPFSLGALAVMPTRLLELSRLGVPTLIAWFGLWLIPRLGLMIGAGLVFLFTTLACLADNQATMVWLALGSIPVSSAIKHKNPDALPVAVVSVLTGLGIALLSTNGVVNAAVGSEAAVMALCVAAAGLMPRFRGVLAWGLAAMVVCRLAIGQWTDTYRDGRIITLSRRVPSGPFEGMRTSPAKLDYIARMQSALRQHEGGKRSLIAFNSIPAAHLMVSIPPALPATWVIHGSEEWAVGARAALAGYVAAAPRPALVLRIKRQYFHRGEEHRFSFASTDPFVRAVDALNPRQLLDTPDFTLFEIER